MAKLRKKKKKKEKGELGFWKMNNLKRLTALL